MKNDLFTTAPSMPKVQKVIFHPPETIVLWSDHTKTIARCNAQDTFSEEFGLAMACVKKLLYPYESFHECLDSAIRVQKSKRNHKNASDSQKPPHTKKAEKDWKRQRDIIHKGIEVYDCLCKIMQQAPNGVYRITFGQD